MKIYISGPITGYEEGNRPAFDAMEARIIELGHEAINPHTLAHDHGKTWLEYMREDIKAMMDADAVVFLEGWQNSRGCKVEYRLALDLDMNFDCGGDVEFLTRKRR